jgi:hypothetical protein
MTTRSGVSERCVNIINDKKTKAILFPQGYKQIPGTKNLSIQLTTSKKKSTLMSRTNQEIDFI